MWITPCVILCCQKLTAYLDLSLERCYIINLNTSIVMPPRDFQEFLVNIKVTSHINNRRLILWICVNKWFLCWRECVFHTNAFEKLSWCLYVFLQAGMYLPQTYLVREELMITERVDSTSDLGYYINKMCNDKDTYRLQRRETILGKCTQINHLIRLCLQ